MNAPTLPNDTPSDASRDELMSALFARLVLQQSNMAMMLLGKMPHPETGQTVCDIEGAKLFIDQLEMLQVKTRGNLGKGEETLLKQSLMSLHLAFVEAVESVESPSQPVPSDSTKPTETTSPGPVSAESPPPGVAPAEEPQKRFTKKY